MEYRCVATSVEGFVQQLAVAYITHGYWFYVAGRIPEGKDPTAVDVKLIDRYGIAISKWARARRKKQSLANMQYLRHERFFILLATKGRHDFFEREVDESLGDYRALTTGRGHGRLDHGGRHGDRRRSCENRNHDLGRPCWRRNVRLCHLGGCNVRGSQFGAFTLRLGHGANRYDA